MKKLEQLTQDTRGFLYKAEPACLAEAKITRVLRAGLPKTIVVKNPCLDISTVLDEMAERDSVLIPRDANAYVASDFNGDTQHIRKDDEGREKFFSVYAVQFYSVVFSDDF